jgi:hypothetical protein
MFESKGRSANTRFGVNTPCSDGYRTEPARRFRFAITWTSLTRQLELREAVERASPIAAQPARETKQSSWAAAAGIAVPPLDRRETRSESNGRWEMVVPKMDRADRMSKELTTARNTDHRNGDIYSPISVPMLSCLEDARHPLFSRAFAAIERCTRSLLAAPSKPIDTAPISVLEAPRLALAKGRLSRFQGLQLSAPSLPLPSETQIAKIEDIQDRRAVREMLLSKITSTLRSRSESLASQARNESSGGAVIEGSGSPYSV